MHPNDYHWKSVIQKFEKNWKSDIHIFEKNWKCVIHKCQKKWQTWFVVRCSWTVHPMS